MHAPCTTTKTRRVGHMACRVVFSVLTSRRCGIHRMRKPNEETKDSTIEIKKQQRNPKIVHLNGRSIENVEHYILAKELVIKNRHRNCYE